MYDVREMGSLFECYFLITTPPPRVHRPGEMVPSKTCLPHKISVPGTHIGNPDMVTIAYHPNTGEVETRAP